MTNLEIETRMRKLVGEERKITREILELINLAESRRLHLERGFSSLFDWLTKSFGYSEAAAQRRIQAARLVKAVPEAASKIETGALTLTNLSKAQSVFRLEKAPAAQKVELVRELEGKSGKEAEKILVKAFPNASFRKNDVLPEETLANLQRVKELLSHALPGASDADVIGYLAKEFLKRKDPLQKTTSAAAKRCVMQQAQARCSYRDPASGRICGSTYQVQVDHIQPKALGGGDEKENLRLLCRAHNIFEAEKIFGRKHMDRFK